MKSHYFFFTSLIILLSAKVIAQKSEIELLAAPSLTSLRGNWITEQISDPTLHVSAGIGFNYLLRSKFVLKASLLYDRKGADGSEVHDITDQGNYVVGSETTEYRNDFQYITVPVQYGRRFGDKIKFDIALGAYASFLLHQELESWSPRFHVNQDYTDTFKGVDFGMSGSFSAYVPLNGALSLKLGLQDNLGLTNIADYKVVDNGSIKHNSLGLHVGLNLGLN